MNILDYLTEDEKKLIKIKSYLKNHIIYKENDECKEVFFIIKGEINIISYSINGEERLISSHKKNDVFANALVFSSSPYFLGDVICSSDCIIYSFSKNDLIKILQNNQLFLIKYINILSQKTINLSLRNKLLSHKNIRERIIYYFEINNFKVKKNISFISKELILPRPSVSREIHKMINEGIVSVCNKYIYLNNVQ